MLFRDHKNSRPSFFQRLDARKAPNLKQYLRGLNNRHKVEATDKEATI